MTDEQTQLLRQILEELKAMREMMEHVTDDGNAMYVQSIDSATSGGTSMATEDYKPQVHIGECVIPKCGG